jgi:phosphoenolpyruvate carboxykinase (ATP)
VTRFPVAGKAKKSLSNLENKVLNRHFHHHHGSFIMRAEFLEDAICHKDVQLLESGAIAAATGKHTGRSANSRFIARDSETETNVDWGDVNKAMGREDATRFLTTIERKLSDQKTYKVKGFIGPFPLEVITPSAWHAAFADNMFRGLAIPSLTEQVRALGITANRPIRIFHDPMTPASQYGITAPEDACILLDPANLKVAIAGSAYAGEIKKSAFSLANYLLPSTGILPMHSSANCMSDGSKSCVIFGLSGTGKTTLSAQAGRDLIGDDEIVWSERGISNLEGGCYAKLIGLTEESEPDIYRAVNSFGSIMENVVIDPATRTPQFMESTKTENTRGSYKLGSLARVFDQTREAKLPEAVVFLTADAFGALPALARLDEWQMRYHFMSGFTAKVAGTEIGLKEPKAAFSACFGAPFMPRAASVYAHLLAERVKASGARVYLLNTGWRGGYATGKRFPLAITRRLLECVQTGEIEKSKFVRHPIFGFDVPVAVAGIDSEILAAPTGPQVEDLAKRFIANAEAKFKDSDAQEICRRGGPMSVSAASAAGAVRNGAESIKPLHL